MHTGIQLYTLRTLDEPLARTLERVADTRLDGVEFGADAVTPEVSETLDGTGLDVASLGAGPETLADPEPALVDAADAVDCERVVLPYLPPERFESRAAAVETADRVSAYVDALADHGLDLCYHNHAHEFTDVGDGETAFDAFVDRATDGLRFELDLGWVGTGGGDPAARLADLGDRTPLVHVKDMRFGTGEFADLGAGDLDVEGCLETAREQGVEWAVYEHDEPDDPLDALERDAATLVEAVEAVDVGR